MSASSTSWETTLHAKQARHQLIANLLGKRFLLVQQNMQSFLWV